VPTTIMRTRNPSQGFTLLEVLIVVMIIGLSYVLIPKMFFSGVSGADLRANARLVAGGLKLTRDEAINKRKPAFFSLDLANRQFTITQSPEPQKLHPEVELKLFTAQDDVVNENVGVIRFFPDGSSNGGRVTVGSKGRAFLIDIDWLTGRVTIDESSEAKV
jgi:general secretion pathway protein H